MHDVVAPPRASHRDHWSWSATCAARPPPTGGRQKVLGSGLRCDRSRSGRSVAEEAIRGADLLGILGPVPSPSVSPPVKWPSAHRKSAPAPLTEEGRGPHRGLVSVFA